MAPIWGSKFSYAAQHKPNGIAEAFIIGEEFIGSDAVSLILGDNIFYGSHLSSFLQKAVQKKQGASLFGFEVKDPERYGVVEFDHQGKAISIEEKPKQPKSNYAVTGLYFYDNHVIEIAKGLKPSSRGELEITDVNREYFKRGEASVHLMGRGFTWLDAGTYESLMQASQFVQVMEERQGHYIASLEEIAYDRQFISRAQLKVLADKLGKSLYGRYLMKIAEKEIVHGSD